MILESLLTGAACISAAAGIGFGFRQYCFKSPLSSVNDSTAESIPLTHRPASSPNICSGSIIPFAVPKSSASSSSASSIASGVRRSARLASAADKSSSIAASSTSAKKNLSKTPSLQRISKTPPVRKRLSKSIFDPPRSIATAEECFNAGGYCCATDLEGRSMSSVFSHLHSSSLNNRWSLTEFCIYCFSGSAFDEEVERDSTSGEIN